MKNILHFCKISHAGKQGGWVTTPEGGAVVAEDLVVEEITSPEDVSKDPSVGPATPSTPVGGSSKTKA